MTTTTISTPDAPAPSEKTVSAGRIHGVIDRLVAAYAEGDLRDEVATAREDYFNRAGKVFEDDAELFDSRLASFLEWYAIERPLQGGPPPAIRALRGEKADAIADDEALAWIAASHHGLFDITEVQGRTVQIADVLGGARFSVVERRSTIGFDVGDLFEARLIWDGRELIFGKTFLFHPKDARQEALDLVDALVGKGAPADEILFLLCRLHVRWHRLGHTGAARIYREGLIRSSAG